MDSYSSELTGSTAFGISDPLYGSVPLATTAWDLNRTGFSGGRVRNCPGFGVGSWGWWFSGRGGNLLNCLKLDRGEPAEGALTTFAVMGAFHPGDDRQAQFLPGSPALTVKDVLPPLQPAAACPADGETPPPS